ncbi:hypothetical protein HYU11_00935 [Candidatus Woesearchaeota archaeon]|nr:hypothetical protein [Candidatus Woesearchaeota archaeon]
MNQDQVLQIIRTRGPIIPSQISKELGTNILFASAILSEFASRNLVKVSNLKIGGSPLYYMIGQEERLFEYIDRLPEREKEACLLLRNSRILRDSILDPVKKVALRQCRDFSKPLEVTINGQKEIFWKWYMVPNDEAEKSIRQELLQQKRVEPMPKELRTEPKAVEQAEPKKKEISEVHPADQDSKPQKSLFGRVLSDYFHDRKIRVLEEQVIKKEKELMFTLRIPSPVGDLQYLCVAFNKVKCNESDLSYAFVQGQIKRLPVLLVARGELTKKANELLVSKEFSNLTFVKV